MKRIFLIRRVVGRSMSPRLDPGKLVIATPRWRRLKPGQVIILEHEGKEKIKRIERVDSPDARKLFVIGDNMPASTDSRHFGWISRREVLGRVLWPRLHN